MAAEDPFDEPPPGRKPVRRNPPSVARKALHLEQEPLDDVPVEVALRREKIFLLRLIESVPAGIAIFSAKGKFLYFNQHFVELWRLPCEIVESGQEETALAWAADQTADPATFLERVSDVYRDPFHPRIEDEIAMKDGRILDRYGVPILEGGVHYGWLWTFRDVTARRESEASLRQLSQTLEQRVVERTVALEEQTEQLRRLAAELASAEHRERKRLAAVLHDDLQQLLVAANMKLSSVARRVNEPQVQDEIARAAGWIGQAGRSARELAHELRPPALYEDGLLPALRWLASLMWKRHRLQVTIRSLPSLSPLEDNFSALLFDCTRELLFNVVKYAGVDHAEVSLGEENGWFWVAVEDAGVGFDPDQSARPREEGGFGLFSISERLEGLGGEMIVESRVGSGCRVELKLPLAVAVAEGRGGVEKKEVVKAASPESRRSEKKGGVRVLVVDDHALVRQGIANILRGDQRIAVVGEAADGVEAMSVIEKTSPEVVLIDVNMPRMNGVMATREIHRRWPEKIVVGLSVQDDEATRNSMLASGAREFLAKSGDADKMIAAILSLADGKA